MDHRRIHVIAKTLCEFEAKDWFKLRTEDRDRFMRTAIMIDYRISQPDPLGGSQLICDERILKSRNDI